MDSSLAKLLVTERRNWLQGYAVGVAAKSTEDTSSGVQAKYKLEGTIESVVREIEVSRGWFLDCRGKICRDKHYLVVWRKGSRPSLGRRHFVYRLNQRAIRKNHDALPRPDVLSAQHHLQCWCPLLAQYTCNRDEEV